MNKKAVAGSVTGLVVALLVVTSLFAQKVLASTNTTAYNHVQMLSKTFAQQDLPSDGKTTVTLIQMPFSTSSASQVESTALFNLSLLTNPPSGGAGGGSSPLGSLKCGIRLDSTVIGYLYDVWYSDPVDRTVGLTGTGTIASGNHTLSLFCTGYISKLYNDLNIVVSGNGMSAIIASS